MCVDSKGDINKPVDLWQCHQQGGNQVTSQTDTRREFHIDGVLDSGRTNCPRHNFSTCFGGFFRIYNIPYFFPRQKTRNVLFEFCVKRRNIIHNLQLEYNSVRSQ